MKVQYQTLNEGINNKTLKLVLYTIASQFKLKNFDTGEKPNYYVVHHIDGDNTNNDISNISLMPKSIHTQAHNSFRKKSNNNKDIKSFFKENYSEYIVYIGPYLVETLYQFGKDMENN